MGRKAAESDDVHKAAVRIRIHADGKAAAALDGQSRILNWVHNRLVEKATECRNELGRIHSFASDPTLPPEVRAEVLAPAAECVETGYGKYGLRNLVPDLKERHPFLRLVHSSPMKNAAIRVTRSVSAHVEGKKEGREVGWPRFRKWSEHWYSLEYDERKGWSVEGRCLRITLGQRLVAEEEMTAAEKRTLLRKRKKDPEAVCRRQMHLEVMLGSVPPEGAYRLEIVKEIGVFYAVFGVRRKAVKGGKAPNEFVYFDPNHRDNFAFGVTSGEDEIRIGNRPGRKEWNRKIDKLTSKRDRCERKSKLVEFVREDGSVHRHWEPSRRWRKFDGLIKRERMRRRDQDKTYMFSLAHAMCRVAKVIGIGSYAPEPCDHKLGKTRRSRAKANRTMNGNSLIGRFKPILVWVAWKSGRKALVVDESGTTRTCNVCGHVVEGGIPPGIMRWTCGGCGADHHRDGNAARNGLRRLMGLPMGPSGNPQVPRSGSDGREADDKSVTTSRRVDWSFVLKGHTGSAWRETKDGKPSGGGTNANENAAVPYRVRRCGPGPHRALGCSDP